MKARCSFKDCQSAIIDIDGRSRVQLPNRVYETFQLMELQGNLSNNENIFLVLKDAWDFDNIGVSKDIPSRLLTADAIPFEFKGESWTIKKCIKYLICADCEKGPIGMVCQVESDADPTTANTFYMLSLASVAQHS